jgi:hypothetical protein
VFLQHRNIDSANQLLFSDVPTTGLMGPHSVYRTVGPYLDVLTDCVAPLLALLGLTVSLLFSNNIRASGDSASDFKTLYASSYCFVHGIDAYQTANLKQVFEQNRVVVPSDWYGHAPVYPPSALAVFSPLTVLPMVQAAYAWQGLSALLMAGALCALSRSAWRVFRLSRPWRLTSTALFAACPLLGFGLVVGNVSVAVAAICVAIVFSTPNTPTWIAATGLAIALLLKPHIAIWLVFALLFGGSALRKEGRRTAGWSCALTTTALVAITGWLWTNGMLVAQIRSFMVVLANESRGGSMDPSIRELLPTQAQITSLHSLIGFGWNDPIVAMIASITTCVGFVAVICLIRQRQNYERLSEQQRLLFFASWFGFGMVATYHRAHDEIVMLILLPWLCLRLKRLFSDFRAWLVVGLYSVISVGPTPQILQRVGSVTKLHSLFEFLAYRQVALASLMLEIVIVWLLFESTTSAVPQTLIGSDIQQNSRIFDEALRKMVHGAHRKDVSSIKCRESVVRIGMVKVG